MENETVSAAPLLQWSCSGEEKKKRKEKIGLEL